jgi:hypothetical protein
MDRRSLLKYSAMLSVTSTLSSLGIAEALPPDASAEKSIVLYCDLAFNPAQEAEMLRHFHTEFKPAAKKFEGYIDVKLLKLRKVIQGSPAPAPNINYRFQLTYKSEELRQKWIASDIHKRVWSQIEDLVTNKDYLVLLTDNA